MPPDYHTHTELCRHAGGMPAEYVAAAEAIGLAEIACTDHVPAPGNYDAEHRMIGGDFHVYAAAVRQVQAASRCRVLFGVEADYHAGCEDYLRPFLARYDFDLVLGSVHTGPFWDVQPDHPQAQSEAWLRETWQNYMALLRQMVQSGMYDVVTHLDLPKRNGLFLREPVLKIVVAPVLDAIAAAGMAVEINTSGFLHGAREAYPSAAILAWMRERGIPIVIGSDAHHPNQVAQFFDRALALARAAGYTQRVAYRQRKQQAVDL